ncbi:uncharacterized protein LOC114970161 [Acropora millepora]|uniref:uncharacterized protein LOC114970161 n=1 Tax=Acropora millepora TaxID=45264 RepID=UPI0010FC66D0|nr:uncharacterized protein LOC114970161 [Acropora millepora]
MRFTSLLLYTFVVFLLRETVVWGQICGKASARESFGPIVDFYVTEHYQTPHLQNPVRFYKEVLVQKDSNITLTCTAKEPETSLPLWLFGTKLQPSMIKWYVNSSFFDVSNCDETAAKKKTCTLSLNNIRPQDCGKYVCKATNQVRCTYDELYITVASGQKLPNRDGISSGGDNNVELKMDN